MTLSIVRLDGRLLTEEERLRMCLTEEIAHDPTPTRVYQSQALAPSAPAAVAFRAWWQARTDPALVGDCDEA